MQDVPTNFDTDLFQIIIKEVENITGSKYDIDNYFTKDKNQEEINKHFKVIADHMRAAAMAINDGAKPSNVGRGYIIRRLIRRAYRSIRKLGATDKLVLFKLIPSVKEALAIYDIEIERVQEVIKKEEETFSKTIKQGEDMLNSEVEKHGKIDEEFAFKMFETYGFPIELTAEILEQKNIVLDMDKFNEYKKLHAERSKGKTSAGMAKQINFIQKIESKVSNFTGYETTEGNSEVILTGEENGKYYTIVKDTPFYATKGGQQWDKGLIGGVEVIDVFNDKYHNHWHVTETAITENRIELNVDKDKRARAARNHSATHLLGKALSVVLGHSKQLGSENDYRRLRLDFPSDKKLTDEQLKEVERLVNEYIQQSIDREYVITTYNKGIEMGALELEHVDYSNDEVRVVVFGDVSKEFCGGTHVDNSKEVERFMITKNESKGSGVYRIEAITSNDTIEAYLEKKVASLEEQLKSQINKNKKLDENYSISYEMNVDSINNAIAKAKEDNKKLNKPKKIEIDVDSIKFEEIDGIKIHKSTGENPGTMKQRAIALRDQFPEALIVLEADAGLVAVASNTHDAAAYFKTNYPDAKGGGQSTFAMGRK